MPTTKYGAATTASAIVADVDLHGRRAIVTGASSGIGVETARALASVGADVTLAVRNVAAGAQVADGIAEKLLPGSGVCTWPRWILPTLLRWLISCAAGPDRCTSWLTMPA